MKPSEKINKIHEGWRQKESYPLSYFHALEQYLDEEYEKKNPALKEECKHEWKRHECIKCGTDGNYSELCSNEWCRCHQ